MEASPSSSPAHSRTSSVGTASPRRRRPVLPPLDLSDLPPPSLPSPPSNTLLITNLNNADTFLPENLETIRSLIDTTAHIHTFCPLKSLRRIIVSFYDESAAVEIRRKLDRHTIMDNQARVYFGQPTPISVDPATLHLQAPRSERLFFISPPPSPPAGWESRNEEPPNKLVHADDLANALARIHARHQQQPMPHADDSAPTTPVSPALSHKAASAAAAAPVSPSAMFAASPTSVSAASASGAGGLPSRRSRSSTIVYRPEEHGNALGLPAIEVEDMCQSPEREGPDMMDALFPQARPIVHTSRPPVELMNSL